MTEHLIQQADNSVLENVIRGGGNGARLAFEELSGRALGGNADAQHLVTRLDGEFSSGALTLPPEEIVCDVKMASLLDKFKSIFSQSSNSNHLLPPDRDP